MCRISTYAKHTHQSERGANKVRRMQNILPHNWNLKIENKEGHACAEELVQKS